MRKRISLDGVWQFQIDPNGQASIEDIVEWREAQVPMPWQAQFEDLREEAGTGWQPRTFEIPLDWADHSVTLHFGAVDYYAQVWLDETWLGEHTRGYLPFEFEIGDRLKPGGTQEPLIVSEFGKWGLPDINLLLNREGREPWWFETGQEWGEGVVHPQGVRRRFRSWHLDHVFGSFDRVIPEHVLVGFNPLDFAAHVHAGLFVGWIHQPVALIAERRYGQGRAVLTTFRLTTAAPGADPTATTLLDALTELTLSK